jgi:hypothetical protein
LGFVPVYRTDAERLDDHEARWSAIFAALLAPDRSQVTKAVGDAAG